MSRNADRASGFHILKWSILLLSISTSLQAEQLPVKTYTAADGLAGNRINQIFRDSHGFLWFCTFEGLSRFDGYKFTNYRIDSEAVQPNVRAFLETRSGTYLTATKAGLYQFVPSNSSATSFGSVKTKQANFSTARFVGYRPSQPEKGRSVWALAEDCAGFIWAGTATGLYRLEQSKQGGHFNTPTSGYPGIPRTILSWEPSWQIVAATCG